MGKHFYSTARSIGRTLLSAFSESHVIGLENIPPEDGFILASNHPSYLDVMCLVAQCPRQIRFASTTKVVNSAILGPFVRGMRALEINHREADLVSTRKMMNVIEDGEIIGIFPEGALRSFENSILNGGAFHHGVISLARLTNAPIVPVIVLETEQFHQVRAWFPFNRTRYAVCFGKPITFDRREFKTAADGAETLSKTFQGLYTEALEELPYQPNII